MTKQAIMPELQIGDVVSGIEIVHTTSYTDRYNVSGTFGGSLVPNPLKGGFSVWLENATVRQVVMGRTITSTRRSNITSRNIKTIERGGIVIFSA